MTLQEMLDMELGEGKKDDDFTFAILRVPGGWIYNLWSESKLGGISSESSCFVPEPVKELYDEEEQLRLEKVVAKLVNNPFRRPADQ